MAHYTLMARVKAGNGKFPFVNVQFSKNHRPIPIEGATYYLRPSNGVPIGESTVFNYFLKTMVFLNDRGIGKYVAREDWAQKKDWPVNVDKRNKNKKYATYTDKEIAAMLRVADGIGKALIRFLVGTGFRIGEAAVAEWTDINWEEKTVSVRFKPKFGFKPKDYEERTIAVSDTLLACLGKYRSNAPDDVLIFPSPVTQTVDKHLDRIINHLIDKANEVGYTVRKLKKPCHAFRVLYATRRHQHGVDIETLRQELGHSDITTTQIYLRSADRESDKHRARINRADRFSLVEACKPFARQLARARRYGPPSKYGEQTDWFCYRDSRSMVGARGKRFLFAPAEDRGASAFDAR